MTPTSSASLPEPSKSHATCAWCGSQLDTIVDLIGHIDDAHLAVVRAMVGARAA